MAKIKVIGTGGIGLCVLPTLCRYVNYETDIFPEADVHLIDGDTFEEKNRNRQEFSEIGPKATQTADDLRAKFPRISFHDHATFVDEDNVIRFLREGDIVMLCVDNHKTRKIISDRACELKNITIISGGNDRHDGNVLTHIRRDGRDITPPLASHYHPEIANPTDMHPSELAQAGTCARMAAEVPQLVIVNNLIAANMLSMFYNLTDPVVYQERVMAKPQAYGEACSDMLSMKTVPMDRFPKKS
jgi:molybdopterin/thiamine biosynthesis adenylyltransferase